MHEVVCCFKCNFIIYLYISDGKSYIARPSIGVLGPLWRRSVVSSGPRGHRWYVNVVYGMVRADVKWGSENS
jgi:hypothetical protein